MKKNKIEKLLFDQPLLYKLKRFLIEDVIWSWILSGIFRLKPNPMPDITSMFKGQRVLVAACGPGDVTTGPLIIGASQVTAFDFSHAFVTRCAEKRADWSVYCGDACHIPHRDNEFDISVIYSSLHHIPSDAKEVLGELARVTRNQLVVVEGVLPSKGLLKQMLRLWWRIVDGGFYYYTLEELEEIVKDLPLKVNSSSLFSPISHMWLGVLDCESKK